ETGPVYDPRSIASNGARQPFAGNQIPESQWNPIGVKLLQYYPNPDSSSLFNNYFGAGGSDNWNADASVKINHRLGDRQSFFARFSVWEGEGGQPNFFRNVASPNFRFSTVNTRSGTYDHSLYTGGWLLHGNYGFTSVGGTFHPSGADFDITTLGFPASMR